MADQLPGMNIFNVLAQVPLDLANLASRQMNETMNTLNIEVQRLGTELAVPPALPSMAGMQGLPALPSLQSLMPAAAAAPAASAQAADVYASKALSFPTKVAGPRVVV